MSAIEAFPDVVERRSAERIRPASAIGVSVGRGFGSIIDVSRGGMRARHSVAVMRGSRVRISFEWQAERFAAIAVVLSSRVASLGGADTAATTFESRFRFELLTDASRAVLERVLAAISSRELRRWVANLHGWSDDSRVEGAPAKAGAFIRCRFDGRYWQKKWTLDRTPPSDGFVVPATIGAQQLASLCETYSRADTDGRHLLRLMAQEAVKEAI